MKRNRLFTGVLILLISMALLTACGKEEGEKEVGGLEKISIDHKLGQTILEKNPERILVFDYGVLDILDSMGLGDRVVGLAKKSLPDYLSKYADGAYEDIGSLQEPNFELIYELEPDLIIIGDRQAKSYKEFEEIGPTLYVSIMDGDYMELFKDNMENLGRIFEREDDFIGEYEKIEKEVEDLSKLAEEKGGKSLFLMANDGELNAYGRGSRFGIMFNEFGLSPVDENIDVSTHGQKISYEYIVEHDPDYIFVMDRGQITGADSTAQDVMENELVRTSQAYKNDNIHYLNSPIWYVASGGIESTRLMIEDIDQALNK